MNPEDITRALRQAVDQVLDIIRLRELCAPIGPPMSSGIFIYRAVIDHAMSEFVDILEFLKGNGIALPTPGFSDAGDAE